MDTKTFWVGDKPGGAWTFQVLDEGTGNPMDLSAYTSARVVIRDTDNNEVELAASLTNILPFTVAGEQGIVVFAWPSYSVFTKPGRWVMQLELNGNNVSRRTTVQEILVKEFGGVSY